MAVALVFDEPALAVAVTGGLTATDRSAPFRIAAVPTGTDVVVAEPVPLTLDPAVDLPEITTAEVGALFTCAGTEAGVTTCCSAVDAAGLEEPRTVPAEGTVLDAVAEPLSWPSAVDAGFVDCRGTIVRGVGITLCTTLVVRFCRF